MNDLTQPLLVREVLRAGATLDDLVRKYHLLVKRGTEFPNLVLLKYHQIESPMGDPLVKQCRGIILDEADNWRVVSRPFDKFFNLGEGHAAKLDWETARAQEKLDGSLMQLYMYKGEWRVGSSGTPDAAGEVNGCGFSFKELFWKVWNELGYQLPDVEDSGTTFLFELMTPYNRVVVRHLENRLVCIGARTVSGWEFAPLWPMYNWEIVREFSLQTPEQVLETFATMDPLAQEGYVVVDGEFRRLKVKHPGYVALHHMRGDGFGPKRILEVIRSGESSEILTHFPEWTEDFTKIQRAYDGLVQDLEREYQEATHNTEAQFPEGVIVSRALVQKVFAGYAVKGRYSAALFSLRAGKVATVREFLAGMNIKSLMGLLGLKDKEIES